VPALAALMQRYVGRVAAYRVRYTSTGYDGKPTAVSGIIVVPDGPPPAGGRRVIAYTHDITARLLEKLCAGGERVDLRILKGTARTNHLHLVS
jgi:hypothetical protein